MSEPVSVETKLGVNKFQVDEGNPHIVVKDHPDIKEFRKLVKACPAGLYRELADGSIRFDFAGCLECGACRILCGSTILEKWEFPQGSMGVEYRYG